MVKLILGKKGSGKTKHLLELCAAATAASGGNVVFIEKDDTLTYDLSHKTRLVSAAEYAVADFDALYGFIAGMSAGNYDITDIFVDSTLKIGGGVAGLTSFVQKLKSLSPNVTLSISADQSEVGAIDDVEIEALS